MKTLASVLACLSIAAGAWAQAVDDVPAEIRQQRDALAQERSRINQSHELQATACWQKFAVNDCLAAVRKSKRAQLDPIHQKELAINAQERAWRTRQRDERLQNKASEPGARSEQ
ncbi:hypothetical protein [Limnohabitans radicicola]|uniref:Lysozyme inhibitor LprI N-terminal domain-containing protein n=1 Tax=Limnohabitans radicicola TaxID=2771427 RepID=A0A927FJ33_9BURK|nr:hypothetical protein [Limnohabitans radicicola]MBD8050983.1 hypothetical protein [Limnohabitans radicicola]